MLFRSTLALLCAWYLLFIPEPSYSGENMAPAKYVYFKYKSLNADWDSPYAHPMVDNLFGDYVFTHQIGNILRIAIYGRDEGTSNVLYKSNLYDTLTDKEPDYYIGMPAQLIFRGAGGVRFADGSQPEDCLPPGTQPIGSESWPYEMRWERVYKNYYDVTLYRTSKVILENCLMTEKNGRYEELEQAFGESSLGKKLDRSFAVPLGDSIEIYHGFTKRSPTDFLSLVEVTEADLPPDFPKNLVRWEPRELPEAKTPAAP